MLDIINDYCSKTEEKFNEDFIYLKEKDNVLGHITSIFKALEAVEGVTLLECTLNTKEDTFPQYVKDGISYVSVQETRKDLIKIKLRLWSEVDQEEEIIEKTLFVPKLVDRFFFYLNSNRFYPIFQIVDEATYHTMDSITLKTLLMPIVIKEREFKFDDWHGNEYVQRVKFLNLFKGKINILQYFLAEFGLNETLEKFDLKDSVIIEIDKDEEPDADSEFKTFKLSKKEDFIIRIHEDYLDEDDYAVANLLELLKGKTIEQIYDKAFWIEELGKNFTRNKNSFSDKGHDILTSFKRILDDSTKANLRIKQEYKEDTFAIIKWISDNYENLKYKDNMSLDNKRIRIYEYLFYDLRLKFSNSMYRYLNKSNLTIKDLKKLVSTLGPMFIIKKISTNELLRYSNAVNGIELFHSCLKFSYRGAQGLGEGSSSVNTAYRDLHPSYIGRISLTTASAGDPGMTGSFTPYIETDGFYFSKMEDDDNNGDEE